MQAQDFINPAKAKQIASKISALGDKIELFRGYEIDGAEISAIDLREAFESVSDAGGEYFSNIVATWCWKNGIDPAKLAQCL